MKHRCGVTAFVSSIANVYKTSSSYRSAKVTTQKNIESKHLDHHHHSKSSTQNLNHTIKLHQTYSGLSLFVRPRHPSKATIMDQICFSAGGLAGVILGIIFGTIVLCLVVFMGMATSILFNWG